ncbi:MAG: hypothetical protein ACFCUQ_13955 [Kiloniellales bacterium]
MSAAGAWVLGGVMGLISLLGLVMASRAQDDVFYLVGLLLFLFGVLFCFGLIKRCTGRPPDDQSRSQSE